MAERIIETKIKLTGTEEYVAGIDQITAGLDQMTSALQRANEAMKEFGALFGKMPNSASEDVFSEFAMEVHQEIINRLEVSRSSQK